MKKLTLFLLTLIISCSAWGATPTKLYLKPNSNWATVNARFAAYFFGNGEKWVSMNPVFDAYEVDVPSGFTKVIFCRMNPGNTTNGWNNKYNQTGDLTIPTNGNDCFTVQDGVWDGPTSSWGKYSPSDLYVAGSMNGWATDQDKLNYSPDNSSASISMLLEPKKHEFKISRKDWKWSKGYEIFNTQNSDVTATNSGGNISFTLENKANVKFILSKDQKISVQLFYDVTVNAGTTGGTVSGGGKDIRHNTASEIKATANTGYEFVGWYNESNELVSPDATYKPTVTSNLNLTAKFQIKSYNVTVTAGEGGFVKESSGTYNHGTKIEIEATANDGYKFVKWDDKNTDNPRTITVTSEATYTAIFEKLPEASFDNPSKLEIGKTYGKLSYRLTMPQNRWYWIVLPFNVNVKDITTSTGKWDDLVYTEYDAEKRAKGENGWINWSKVDRYNDAQVLKANKGYVIGPKDGPFDKDGDFVVTFPSASPTNTVADKAELTTTEATGENEKDNNWHIIGTGLYHPTTSLDGISYIAVPDNKDNYNYYYVGTANGFFQTELNHTFNPFEAFFVQHGGTYSATATTTQSAAELAPVARAKAQEQEQIYLINMNEARTVVILNAEGSEGYTAGEDFLEMNLGSRIEMIYSFDGTDALAFNHRATEAQSINLGGYVATAGEQTISLNAYNGNAEAVTLIDNLTGETADLLASNYTFTAEVGSLDGRFTIVFAAQKAGDTTVDCYNSVANQVIAYGTADACTVSGLTAGKAIAIYNTMGQLVFCTVADSETITLPSLTAGNYLILHNGTTNKVALR